jgi:hypothetical protein
MVEYAKNSRDSKAKFNDWRRTKGKNFIGSVWMQKNKKPYMKKRKSEEKKNLFSCVFLATKQRVKQNLNKTQRGTEFLQYLLIAVENPSATRAERSLALERERAIVYDQILDIQNLLRCRGSKFSTDRGKRKPSTAAKERNLLVYLFSRDLQNIMWV